MSTAYLDTHIAVWLHDGLIDRLSDEAKRQIEDNDLLVSPVVLVEMQYLFERKRVGVKPLAMYHYLHGTFGLTLCSFPFPAIAMEAVSCTWTRDPFDRMIVAQAKANGDAVLVTADREIRRHYRPAVW